MANYPVKMLKDESGTPFVPLVSTQAVRDPDGKTVQQILDTKLSPENLHGGQNVTITTQDDDCYINVEFPPSGTLIDNLSTSIANQGALDAHQGYELKNMIPEVVNNLTTVDSTKALSAYQGYLLSNRVVPTGGSVGQILIKNSNADNDVAWTSDYLPLSGGTLTGKVTFAAAGREDSNAAGFTYDQYGNLMHKRDNTTDVLQIKNYAGSKTIGFFPENGDIEAAGEIMAKRLYQSGEWDVLPDGDGTDPVYWCALPNGTYWYGTNVANVSNMPATYGFVTKDGCYTIDGSKGDFTVIFQKQATGAIYRTSGNYNTTTCSWVQLAYTSDLDSYLPLSGGTMTGKLTLGSQGYEDSAEAGYTHDQYGNMTHKRTTAGDNWHINNNAGSSTFMFYPETGDEKIYGDMYVNSNRLVTSFMASSYDGDLNNLTTAGCYFFTNTPTNAPCYNGWVLVLTYGSYIKQLVLRLGTVNSNDFNTYVRTRSSTAWSNWTQIK